MTTISTSAHPILSYDRVARSLHWLMAALIGVSILCLVVLRIAWRAGHQPPTPEPTGWLLECTASLGHALLYCLMVAVPLIGLGFAVWSGQGINLGLVSIAPVMAENEAVAYQIGEFHELTAYAMVGLASLHALAGLWHHFVRKDDVLRHMLPPQ